MTSPRAIELGLLLTIAVAVVGWAFTVERRLSIGAEMERLVYRIERLEDRLHPLLVQYEVDKIIKTAGLPPVVGVPASFQKDAARDVDDFLFEQRQLKGSR